MRRLALATVKRQTIEFKLVDRLVDAGGPAEATLSEKIEAPHGPL
jgi:hypothetical protein